MRGIYALGKSTEETLSKSSVVRSIWLAIRDTSNCALDALVMADMAKQRKRDALRIMELTVRAIESFEQLSRSQPGLRSMLERD